MHRLGGRDASFSELRNRDTHSTESFRFTKMANNNGTWHHASSRDVIQKTSKHSRIALKYLIFDLYLQLSILNLVDPLM